MNQPGEYVLQQLMLESFIAANKAQALTCWVNSNDLNYSTCVIENGTNTTGGTAQSYEIFYREILVQIVITVLTL